MLNNIGLIAAYFGVGIGLLAVSYTLLDWLTPGKLGEVIMGDAGVSAPGPFNTSRTNAAILASATILSLGLVLFFVIFFTGSARWKDLDDVAVYGAEAIILQHFGFLILDAITPGRLAEKCFDPEHRGAAILASAFHFAVALVICSSLT